MSDFQVRVVEIKDVRRHENADLLSIAMIGGEGGFPVVFKTGDYKNGDKAVYVPVSAAVPADDPRWSFLVKPGFTKPFVEVEAKRLRGVFSMGLLTPADPSWEIGRDVAEEFRITRAEAVDASSASSADNIADPGLMPVYTDIDNLRAHPHLLVDGEEVIMTEKVHGQNMRAVVSADGATLYCGSRTRWKNPDGGDEWSKAGVRFDLLNRLRGTGLGIYGELYGNVAGMRYDASNAEHGLRIFDVMDLTTRRYLDVDDFLAAATMLKLPTVPVLYRGPWSNDLRAMVDGASTLAPAHTREGFVVRPVRERRATQGGTLAPRPSFMRVVLKYCGERYLTKQWDMAVPLGTSAPKGKKR